MAASASTLSITDLEKVYFDSDALAPIYEINEALIRSLVEGSRALHTNALVADDPVLRVLRDLSSATITQLARIPLSWIHADFELTARWTTVTAEHIPTALTSRTVLDFLLSRSDCERLAPLVMDAAAKLAQESLPSARIIFGMPPLIGRSIAAMPRALIQQIGRNRPEWMRVRWGTRPERWLDILDLARGDPEARVPGLAARALLYHFADLEGCNTRSVQNTSLSPLAR